ncbi:MAG: GNAT family N-acetyltransferase [Oscillibacter sp.]|jgi:regulator of nucleoside diphosphate kinase|nr:GNAT family N-acetyltransferase [Oscillibacter sp.]
MDKAASIFLRTQIEPQDVRNMADWMRNKRVTKYLNEAEDVSGQLEQLVDALPPPLLACRLNQRGRFLLVCREHRDSIGFVRLVRQPEPDSYEVVFAIGDEELWGNGFGSQALQEAQKQAFLDWRARKLTAKIYADNVRSMNTVRRCGFTCEKRQDSLARYSITMDEYLDHLKTGS